MLGARSEAHFIIIEGTNHRMQPPSLFYLALAVQTSSELMLPVPAGEWTMGAERGGEPDERPAHKVHLASFKLDTTEVTQEAYAHCVEARACKLASLEIRQMGPRFNGPQLPVVGVSALDADAYCAWRGARLPTEAEFERAVRGDDGRRYPWGNDKPSKSLVVYATDHLEAMGSHAAGAGPYGHQDLSGNAWEWLSDAYDPKAYTRASSVSGTPADCTEIIRTQNELRLAGKQGFTGSNPIPRVCERGIRGGAYNQDAQGIRSTNRVHHPASFRLRMTGFRCATNAD